MERQTELLVRLDERVESMTTDMTDIKSRLKAIEISVAEDKNKKMGMYAILVSIGAFVSWLIGNLYVIKNWIIP